MWSYTANLPVKRVTTLRDNAKDVNHTKALGYVEIPEYLRGKNATAATYKAHLYGYEYSLALSVACKTNSNPSNDWTDSTAYNVIDAYALEDLSNAQSINTTLQQYSWNVLGDTAKGVKYALAQSRAFVTLALTGPAATAAQKVAGLLVGVDDDDDQGSLKYFEYAGRSGGNSANVSYLTVIVDMPEEAPNAPTTATVNGSGSSPVACAAGFPVLGWAPPTNTGVSYYEVQVNGGAWVNVGNVTSYRLPDNLDPAATQAWAVRAVNAYGTSAALAGNSFTVPTTWTENIALTTFVHLSAFPVHMKDLYSASLPANSGATLDSAIIKIRQETRFSGSGTCQIAGYLTTNSWSIDQTPAQLGAVDLGTPGTPVTLDTGDLVVRELDVTSRALALYAASPGVIINVTPAVALQGTDGGTTAASKTGYTNTVYYGNNSTYGLFTFTNPTHVTESARPYLALTFTYTGTSEPPAATGLRPNTVFSGGMMM
jgi:hypothetical protein